MVIVLNIYNERKWHFMNLKKKKEYLILTMVSFGIGFIIFGTIAACNRELLGIQWNPFLTVLLYGFGGGILVGGLISGIILFSNFIKDKNLFLKIILCILFPITFILICYIGILSFLPYEIYNFVVIRKLLKMQKKCDTVNEADEES